MKGEVYIARLNPIQGSEQAGIRPFVVVQRDELNAVLATVVEVPLTTNLKRASLPTSVFIPQGEGGLPKDSVAVCNQVRVVDKSRLVTKLGTLSSGYMSQIDAALRYTLGLEY